MTPAVYPLALYRGDTYRWLFRCWSDAAMTQPADLSGVVAKAQIRNQPGGATVVALVCTVALINQVNVVLPAEDSRRVPLAGAWDLQLTFEGGDVLTIVAGAVTVIADVTDSTLPTVTSSYAAGF